MLQILLKHDVKALQAFVAIVECRGISAAQARLNMSQSAISTHLAHLETSLGMSLCQRGRGGFELTRAGEQLYHACLRLLQATQEFHHDMQGIKQQCKRLSGVLRLCMVDHMPDRFTTVLAELIRQTYRHHPDLQLVADIRSPQEIETAIATREMDLGIGYFAQPLKNLRYHPVLQETQCIYCHRDHPAARDPDLNVAKLEQDYAWVRRGYLLSPSLSQLNPQQLTATAYHMEVTLLFILAGSHIGFLPRDYAAPLVDEGTLTALLPDETAYQVEHMAVFRPENDARIEWVLSQLQSLLAA
ncbi:DNA-binding transcriptional LysR family regulator [Neisseria sp. HSC-16F19]|nr:LysR family transcriptional regulator [Neisseria sp. HSC-16F19]MCP2040621.1 DNA-binding transcriptional LysR family regulator [Neisseria sp. HSC-16F19]